METRVPLAPPHDEKALAALRICARLQSAGFRALLAGGCVRDLLRGVSPKDYDVATNAIPAEVESLFPRTYAVGAAFGVIVVNEPECSVEVATFRQDGPYLDGRRPSSIAFCDPRHDAYRRDFTINALFYDPVTHEVIDYVNGLQDLHAGILRTVGDPQQRFAEDYLRLLRAVRFAARLEYVIESGTFAAIRAMAANVVKTSAERIRDELTKMLTEGAARRAFELLDETGLLAQVLPEIAAMKGVEQPPEFHPEGDVFTHTLLMLEHMGKAKPELAFSVLLHDVGKPVTQTFEDRIRFNYHDKAGARMAEAVCKRLRISNAMTGQIVWLVENHMRLTMVPRMRESKRKRFLREPWFPELLTLCRLDCMASHLGVEELDWIEDCLANLSAEELKPEPLITGKDLLAMGYAAGPLFTEILHAVEDAQLEGHLSSPEAARAFVREHWSAESENPQ